MGGYHGRAEISSIGGQGHFFFSIIEVGLFVFILFYLSGMAHFEKKNHWALVQVNKSFFNQGDLILVILSVYAA